MENNIEKLFKTIFYIQINVDIPFFFFFQTNDRSDALAEAMAHVHGDYLDESVDSVNVEMEMVVESVDHPNGQELRIVSVESIGDNEMAEERLDDEENASIEYGSHDQDKENDNDNETVSHGRAGTISSCKSSMVNLSLKKTNEKEKKKIRNTLLMIVTESKWKIIKM